MKLTDLAKHGWHGEQKHNDEGHACFCIGPQNGETECPCALRNKRGQQNAAWLEGFEAGRRVGRKEKPE